ncbi:endoribonuclease Dcr-1 [Toxorhynchites rutilus septentrionalis]|uniref:endoribonuclease Dcr-1 n=1 Tax=Toxorhynchites rutilus septentrionalis TaxID=329112 RepID=UPI002478C567|nr:endoribonuclease Dcr-1 [Toxorhynchites rutilus septentrionalis]
MAYYWADNIHTTALTPRDYQVELLASARERNIILCLAHNSSKEFIALKLIHELGFQLRRFKGKKRTIYICDNDSVYSLIQNLTDLKVIYVDGNDHDLDWEQVIETYHVIIINERNCLDAIISGYLDLDDVNLLIIDECHKIYGNDQITELFNEYYNRCKVKPKILGLAGPLHNARCVPGRLSAELEQLEQCLKSKAETASDIVTVLRYCTKPKEIIIQCAPPRETETVVYLRELVLTQISFLEDHRYDPSEIYEDDEFLEELKNIPDPKVDPLKFLREFLAVLEEMGPWCADRAALALIIQIEKQKIKTPYERHFLLLCLASTVLVHIRSYCDLVFKQYKNEMEKIEAHSTPKVLRILQVFKLFNPDIHKDHEDTSAMILENAELESCHFESCKSLLHEIKLIDLQKFIERVEEVGKNIENITDGIVSLKNSLKSILDTAKLEQSQIRKHKSPAKNGMRHPRQRKKGNPGHRQNRANFHNQNDPDALCALIFCNSKFTTRILYGLFYEVIRSNPQLNYINVQYTLDKSADPVMEPKEAEVEHRKQEEVLKRFRMHECNLLIGTSVLEEGIDLPKCNLVIRWNEPVSYRSYVQCKGRARAASAYHVLFIAPKVDLNSLVKQDSISDRTHRYVCGKISSFDVNMAKSNKETRDNDDDDDDNESVVETMNSCQINELVLENNENMSYKAGLQVMENCTNEMIEKVAIYMEIEKLLLRKCGNIEPPESDQLYADCFNKYLKEYRPLPESEPNSNAVGLGNAIQMINKYCAKLPSDTFTKLTPLWRCAKTVRNGHVLFQYTIRMPINSPLKRDIMGLPMPTEIMARRIAAYIACMVLHKTGELDNSLQPIGKESFRAFEADWEDFELESVDAQIVSENSEPRPGTTKRRQYYYKRIASAFSECRPTVGSKVYLYHINMTLQCPIPEEQNTRGRKIYPPEDSPQGFGILTSKLIPKVSAFPIFTRSGEVKVALSLCSERMILNQEQLDKINLFINYTFTKVLRLQKYLMLYDPEATENCFFIVPTITRENAVTVDWEFIDKIAKNVDKMPNIIPEVDRKDYAFDSNQFKDAVVMPWYRNQDQPQYFYVAEICYHLSPKSSFPGLNYSTFEEYYYKKYSIQIQNCKQPLLDVDHTSARLNFLTPRYVNRKGVALPTSSEETKRAKRENLEQKQILIPELCTIHPFPASLWRAAVCLPCILYRINALLLADEIRKEVARDLGLGSMDICDDRFEWPILNFGWSLADVLKKSREAKLSQAIPVSGEIKKLDSAEDLSNVDKEKEEKIDEDKNEGKPENEISDQKTANDLLEEAESKLKVEGFQIGTWSNEMAESIELDGISDEENWGLPPNVNICSRNRTNIRYGSPTSWDVGTKEQPTDNRYYTDSEASYDSDDDLDSSSGDNDSSQDYGLKIEFKSDNVAEAIESEDDILKRQKQMDIINSANLNEQLYQNSKNVSSGFDCTKNENIKSNIRSHEEEFERSTKEFKEQIRDCGTLIKYDEPLTAENVIRKSNSGNPSQEEREIYELFPYASKQDVETHSIVASDGTRYMDLEGFYEINRKYLPEVYTILGTGDIFDRFNDENTLSINEKNEKTISLNITNPFVDDQSDTATVARIDPSPDHSFNKHLDIDTSSDGFSFDYQPDLNNHPGPSPSIVLQALTMSNANDGINLERLETIGDSFLKYAITTYLYCTYENVHEGKLSHLRSKQVSNLNLYRLGRRKVLGESMIATKFEPHDNWLPPCYYVPKELEQALIDAKIPACHWNLADLPDIKKLSSEEICKLVKERAQMFGLLDDSDEDGDQMREIQQLEVRNDEFIKNSEYFACFIPYNLVTQHSIPDKSVADCVEALIGAYLIECGPRGALLLMAWLGIRVLPVQEIPFNPDAPRIPGSTTCYEKDGKHVHSVYGYWIPPKSPLLTNAPNPKETLEHLLDGYDAFEASLGYRFNDRSYLLQAMTHASYCPNRLTDCYQRLEFLGDAVLDYLITRHLYEDPRQHSPGALTDLRSALVNNTIFASLAVRHDFHKYFRHLSPGLNDVIDRFVRIQQENGHSISEEYYLRSDDECDEAEDVEVPKALGDVFESVAGAIFLDSNMSLDAVWKVYRNMMGPEIEQFSNSVPKSPIRELLELEPETAKFGKPEKLADGRRVRVTVEVFGKGTFRGIGRNYRIAKCTAAKCALRQLKKMGLINKRR